MFKTLFISGLNHISISPELGRGERFKDSFYITNDARFIESLLTEEFVAIAGQLETVFIRNPGAVIYSIEEGHTFADSSAALAYLDQRLAVIRLFLQSLWLVKDNSVDDEMGYIQYPYKPRMFVGNIAITRNFYPSSYTDASGTRKTVAFSREELRKARELCGTHLTRTITVNAQSAAEKSRRFTRAEYFIQTARASADIGVKLTNYATALESLFSTDAQELSHKLAERVACFLESDPTLRIQIFKDVKKANGIRSKVVHGASGSKEVQNSAVAICINIASLLRRVLSKIISDPSLQQRFMTTSLEKEMDAYFLSLVLG
jgi:hypothetical protein